MAAEQASMDRCYHHNGMRALIIGRVMGMGLRVAGRMAGQRIAGSGVSAPVVVAAPLRTSVDPAVRGRNAAQTMRNVSRATQQGAGGFWRSFRRAGGIVWLQVTGCFFLLPVAAFSPVLWRTRLSWAQGPDHRTFVSSAIVVTVFFYLGVTSFWRAGRK
jgi:hypothetical protein